AVDRAFLEALGAASHVTVSLQLPGDSGAVGQASPDTAVVQHLSIAHIRSGIDTDGSRDEAQVVVAHSLAPLNALRRSMDWWFAVAAGVSALAAALLAAALASRISNPLAALADQTARLDLERLDVSFATDRGDEVGALARMLETMTQRLRVSVRTLREAERQAALGDLARQVNHDIKNGLIPIRNVLRHLGTVAREEPQDLTSVYRERENTLESSVEYLEQLAATYAALSPKPTSGACDLNTVVQQVVRAASAPPHAALRTQLAPTSLVVDADELTLRRIVENLVTNAVDSLRSSGGLVTVRTERLEGHGDRPMARITVADTGTGMDDQELERAFQNFYTTKPTGTGLGLSIVRRLVNDIGGTLRVESKPDIGTQAFIDVPLREETP
ncbi:MAG: HAMP domain-containing sensor histidine kinase, partial [Gemmatimonadales bacterium]